jgi:hypothetical protein
LRRYSALAALLALLLAIGASASGCRGGGDGQPADDAARVREAAETIRSAIQLDDWKTVYRSFADAFREQCTEADFVAGATERAAAFKAVKFDVGEVVVKGDSATVSITFSNGEQTADEWPFVRERGEWHLLSAVGIEGCGFTTPTPTPTPAGTP